MLSAPALICLMVLNDALDVAAPATEADCLGPDCARASPVKASSAAAMLMAAVPRKRRRRGLVLSGMCILPLRLATFNDLRHLAPFYEQKVVKAFHDLTHESLARSHRAASVKKRRSRVKGRRSLSAATLDAAKAR